MKKILLCILDGFGLGDKNFEYNAVAKANTPNLDRILKKYPHSFLDTSGESVGLPSGQMGNSEVGHTAIGSGRVVLQDLPMITKAMETIAEKTEIKDAINILKKNGKTLHLIGLLSDGGVHSHIDHIIGIAQVFTEHDIKVKIHAITDGRDTSSQSALNYLSKIPKNMEVSTIIGRYYAMDRDNRCDRTEIAYNCLVSGIGDCSNNIQKSISENYKNCVTDEFIKPIIAGNYNGMEDGDAIFMANFRADRVRQILSSILMPGFSGFKRTKLIKLSSAIGMMEYSTELNNYIKPLFRKEIINNSLGEIISNMGLKQLRIAETEKYAHVTFFFSCGVEKKFLGEDRILIPSPKVATYDLAPEMSIYKVLESLEKAIDSREYHLIVVNIANGDMVGHTGNFAAAKKAVEDIDSVLGVLKKKIVELDDIMLVTADHGNIEEMIDEKTGEIHTQHTTQNVPFILIGNNVGRIELNNGNLTNIAPTILELMNINKPEEMTANSLILK